MNGIDNKRLKEKGLTILEALISTAIVGIGFVAVFQMVNYAVISIDVSGERTKSNYLTAMVAEDVERGVRKIEGRKMAERRWQFEDADEDGA